MTAKLCLKLDFGEGGDARDHQIAGWALPEPGFCWAIGEFSNLRLPAVKSPEGFFIEIYWRSVATRAIAGSQFVAVAVDGRTVLRRIVTGGEIIAFWCPPSAPDAAETIVEFHHPDYFVPGRQPGFTDGRELSLMFIALRLISVDERLRPGEPRSSAVQIGGATVEAVTRALEAATGGPASDLFGRFEVIGGNCDLGLALRRFGYESLSLLRFGGATLESATRGLENGFSNIGVDLEPHVVNNNIQEWMIRDKAGYLFHTGQSSKVVSKDKVVEIFRKFAKRLALKLLNDISDDEKIFVFSDHLDLEGGRTIENIMPLYLALRARGGSRLLWVRPVGRNSPLRGSVTEILPGLALGRLDLVAPPMAAGSGITLGGWPTVLLNASILFHGGP